MLQLDVAMTESVRYQMDISEKLWSRNDEIPDGFV